MARRRKAKGDPGEVETDMTSMIDVVFLLLIFFMLATKFKMPEGTLRSYLPKIVANRIAVRSCRRRAGSP